jgi:hypothetical protein
MSILRALAVGTALAGGGIVGKVRSLLVELLGFVVVKYNKIIGASAYSGHRRDSQ